AAGGDEHVGAEVFGDRTRQSGGRGQVVHPVEVKQHHFAPMTKHHLQVGKLVEDAGEDQAQQRDTCVVVPADAVGGQAGVDRVVEAAVVGGLYGRRRDLRVQVERGLEGGGGLKDRPEFAAVQAFTTAAGEDQRAVEAQFGYRPLQFAGGP